jgi:mRNA-degrading endonuclease RelE of RelBE toxin-antitoxin system
MKYQVLVNKKAQKGYKRMPKEQQKTFLKLLGDLENIGPFLSEWKNYSKLGKNEYHCHLSHSWVACWRYEKGTIKIEVEYVGSRGSAPYA